MHLRFRSIPADDIFQSRSPLGREHSVCLDISARRRRAEMRKYECRAFDTVQGRPPQRGLGEGTQMKSVLDLVEKARPFLRSDVSPRHSSTVWIR